MESIVAGNNPISDDAVVQPTTLRQSATRSRWILFLGLAITVVALILVLRNADIQQSLTILARIKPSLLILPSIAAVIALFVRGLRWQMLFAVTSRPGLLYSATRMAISNLLNLFLPARAGDIYRCTASGKITAGAAVAALGVEKIADGLQALAILFITAQILEVPAWFIHLSLCAAVIFVSALVVLAAFKQRPSWAFAIIKKSKFLLGESITTKLLTTAEHFINALAILHSPYDVTVMFVLTVFIWMAEALMIVGLAEALLMNLGLPGAAITSSAVALGGMIPAAPGSLGTYEYVATATLHILGFEREPALALTLFMHAWSYFTIICCGLPLIIWHVITSRQRSQEPNM
jgi:glycosyltransferase 2 family protein